MLVVDVVVIIVFVIVVVVDVGVVGGGVGGSNVFGVVVSGVVFYELFLVGFLEVLYFVVVCLLTLVFMSLLLSYAFTQTNPSTHSRYEKDMLTLELTRIFHCSTSRS